ncbi:hypothetical protein [Pantanalinema sp. GBBB05]|uniref:hypothetical protein n=1 Tax=Pantanalinema sp. GBBB05 TaxID=2604139 RepID=UPI001D45847B|nr:hypothetical protein [Pantanalinema sp. GBBB05]
MYVKRNAQGKIVGAAEEKQGGWGDEWLADDSNELLAYLQGIKFPKDKWSKLDKDMANTELFAIAYSSDNDRARDLMFYAFANSEADDDRRMADLQFAISQIRATLPVDYTPAQLQQFRDVLTDNGFDSDWVI